MRYIFENVNSNYDEHKGINILKYSKWMNSILRRSEEIGKVELPICSIILDVLFRRLISLSLVPK